MSKTIEVSRIGALWAKQFPAHHWTWTARGRLTLHRGDGDKCRRVHRDARGFRA